MDWKDRKGSLDRVFSDLIHEANLWASDRTPTSTPRTMPHVNGRLEDKDDTNIDACLEQLARAISAHVTDILIERLGLEERSVQTQETSTAMDLTPVSTVAKPPVSDRPQHINLKPSTSRSVPCTVRSLPQSPTTCRKAPPTRRGNDFGCPQNSPTVATSPALPFEQNSNFGRFCNTTMSMEGTECSSTTAVTTPATDRSRWIRTRTSATATAATESARLLEEYSRSISLNGQGPHYGERSERTAGRRKGDAMVRYHSENRLNRIEAERSGNETPLENRASRLRRASISKRLAGAGGRSQGL